MSKIFNYYPPEYNPALDSSLRRNDMVAVLNKLEDPNLPEDIWYIVSAFLLNPLTNGELETIKGPRAIEALNGEVAFLDTITTKTAEDYIAKYKTYGVLEQFTLADLGRRVFGAYRLYITDLARLNEYQVAFPTVRHLLLQGERIPDKQVISARGLEQLDLFALETVPSANFIPAIQRVLIFGMNNSAPAYSQMVVQIALKHIAKLSVACPLKDEICEILSTTPKECYAKFWEWKSVCDLPYIEEWEVNKRIGCREHFDFDQITHLSDSVYAPYSKIRNLFLRTFLRGISKCAQTIVSDYLTEHYFVDFAFIRKFQGIKDAKNALKAHIRQNASSDPEYYGRNPNDYRRRYEQVCGSDIGFQSFYEKVVICTEEDPIELNV
jgi:hypothetical protein